MTTLEKIMAEIENIKDFEVVNGGLYVRQYDVAQIIDKYADQEPTIGQLFSCEEVEELRNKIWKQVEQEPCDDAISRQAVIDYIDKMPSELTADGRRMIRRRTLEEYISDTLPSVRPQELTREEQALLQKWRDNRGVSMEEFSEALNALQESKGGSR